MDRYTINCTSEQTKKALALGAPIDHSGVPFEDLESLGYSEYYKTIIYGIIPTAEQMIGWLEEQGEIVIIKKFEHYHALDITILAKKPPSLLLMRHWST